MSISSELTPEFIQLVKTVLTDPVNEAIKAGLVEVHIGFAEVEVVDDASYGESLVRPYVHITPVN